VNDAGYAFRMRALKDGHSEKLKLHRVIMCCSPNDGLEIDHVNRRTLDNRRSNLRVATRAENMRNRMGVAVVRSKDGQTLRIGLNSHPHQEGPRSFRARLRVNGKRIDFGLYPTRELAQAALDEACASLGVR
jgi:hypothetical protein